MARVWLGLLIGAAASAAWAQGGLQAQIRATAAEAKGKVSVACSLPGTALNCALNPNAHPPMQSVFKLPLGITVLAQMEKGKFTLDQPIRFLKSDRIPHAYSPLQDKYPETDVDVPLRELLRLSVSLSDNCAADLLLRLIGGPKVVEAYMHGLGVSGFQLVHTEADLHREVQAQYQDWFEPTSAVTLLRRISDHSPLNPANTALLLDWMRTPPERPSRIGRGLPVGTDVMHKTGSSDVSPEGLAYATNDIGLIALPDGRRLAVAVFVTDATADSATRDKVIGQIAREIYDAALQAKK